MNKRIKIKTKNGYDTLIFPVSTPQRLSRVPSHDYTTTTTWYTPQTPDGRSYMKILRQCKRRKVQLCKAIGLYIIRVSIVKLYNKRWGPGGSNTNGALAGSAI